MPKIGAEPFSAWGRTLIQKYARLTDDGVDVRNPPGKGFDSTMPLDWTRSFNFMQVLGWSPNAAKLSPFLKDRDPVARAQIVFGSRTSVGISCLCSKSVTQNYDNRMIGYCAHELAFAAGATLCFRTRK